MTFFFLMGAALALSGAIGYVVAVLRLIRTVQLNDALDKPPYTDCGDAVLEVFGAGVVCLLGAMISGIAL